MPGVRTGDTQHLWAKALLRELLAPSQRIFEAPPRFLAVAQLGGVSHAAPRLGLDPATVSRRLKRLEGSMRAALFARSSTGLVLTHAGERLRAFAARG